MNLGRNQIILGIIIIIAAIGAGGYFAQKKYQFSEIQNAVQVAQNYSFGLLSSAQKTDNAPKNTGGIVKTFTQESNEPEQAQKIIYTETAEPAAAPDQTSGIVQYPKDWTDSIDPNSVKDADQIRVFAPLHYGFSLAMPLGWRINQIRGGRDAARGVLYSLYSPETKKLIKEDETWPLGDVEIQQFENIRKLDSSAQTLEEYLVNQRAAGAVRMYERINAPGREQFGVIIGRTQQYYAVYAQQQDAILVLFFNHRADKALLSEGERKIIDSLTQLEPITEDAQPVQCPSNEFIQKVFTKTRGAAVEIDCRFSGDRRLVLTTAYDPDAAGEIPYSEYHIKLDQGGVIYGNVDIGTRLVLNKGAIERFVAEPGSEDTFRVYTVGDGLERGTVYGWLVRHSKPYLGGGSDEVVPYWFNNRAQAWFKKFSQDLHLAYIGAASSQEAAHITGIALNRSVAAQFETPRKVSVSADGVAQEILPPLLVHSYAIDLSGVSIDLGSWGTYEINFDVLKPASDNGDEGFYLAANESYYPMYAFSREVGADSSVVEYNQKAYQGWYAVSADLKRQISISPVEQYQPVREHRIDVLDTALGGEKDPIRTDWEYADMAVISPDSQTVAYRARKGDWWYIVQNHEPGTAWKYVSVIAYTSDGIQHALVQDETESGERWLELRNKEVANTWEYADHMVYLPQASGVAYRAKQVQNGQESWFLVVNGKPQRAWDYIDTIWVDAYDGAITHRARDAQGNWFSVTLAPASEGK